MPDSTKRQTQMPAKRYPASSDTTRLIRTKLAPPRSPRHIVRRASVLSTLALGGDRKLCVVRAPAGFGKTTVLTDWREHLIADKHIVAWLSLDAEDDDPSRLVAYLKTSFAEALGPRAEEIPELLNHDPVASPKVALTSLVNALQRISDGITLILDDADRVHHGPILDLLAFLILRGPPNLHFVVATRTELSLPLAHLRARDELVEIDASSMRFDIRDTRRFLHEFCGLTLDASQTRSLHEATEGWAAGLQMAAIALRGMADTTAVIQSFSGTHRAVNDYLAEAVLPHIAGHEADFLLHTSILERLNGSLATALTGVADGKQMLERLAERSLFIQVLDSEGRWFRYHALFAEFLRDELAHRHPEQLKPLHALAAQWFADHELWSEAVRHALAAERIDLASLWVERCAMREVEDSRVHDLLAWVRKLPDAAVGTRLRIAMAWALLLTIRLDEAATVVEDLARARTEGSLPPGDATGIDAELLSLRFCITALRDDTAGALTIGEQCRPWITGTPSADEHAVWVYQALLNGMTHCYMLGGDLERARAVLQPEHYPVLDDPRRNLFTASYRACVLAGCDIQEGRLLDGARHLRQALELAESHAGRCSAAATLVACSLAALHYEWDELDELDQLLADRLDLIDDACFLDSVRSAYVALARLSGVRGDFAAAHGFLERAEVVASRRRWLRLAASALAEHVRLWLIEGRVVDAERTLKRLEAMTDPHPPAVPCAASETWRLRCVARARMHLYRHDAAAAIGLLRGIMDDENPASRPYPAVRTRILLAIALKQGNQDKAALEQTALALDCAGPAEMIRSIGDEGDAAAALIGELTAARRIPATMLRSPWFGRLRNALKLDEAVRETGPIPKAASDLSEALSQREREVLTLIAQGLSNEEAAENLKLATETVKWHLKNIYGKLGVSSRTLAVHRARQMDLLRELG